MELNIEHQIIVKVPAVSEAETQADIEQAITEARVEKARNL